MKKTNIFSVITLFFLLASCGPVTPVPVPAASPTFVQTTTPPSQVASWPGLRDGWMTFKAAPTINNIVYDPSGAFWVTTVDGLYRLDIKTSAVKHYPDTDELPKPLTRLTYYDGKVWVFSESGEKSAYLSGEKWTVQTTGADFITEIFDTEGGLWFTARNDIYYFDGQGWKMFDSIPKEYSDGYISQVANSKDGSLWVSFSTERTSGILRFDGHTWQNYPNLARAYKMLSTSDGTLWFELPNQLVSFDGQDFAPLVLPGNYYSYEISNLFLTPTGSLWFHNYHNEAFLVEGQNVTKQAFGGFGELPDDAISTPIALIPEGWVFQGQKGIYIYKEKNWKKYELVKSDNLLASLVGDIVIGFAPDGALWLSHQGSLVRFDGRQIEKVLSYGSSGSTYHIDAHGVLWQLYSGDKGLTFGELAQENKTYVDLHYAVTDFSLSSDGSAWLALKDGFIAKFSPDDLDTNGFVDLDKIKIGGEQLGGFRPRPLSIQVGEDGTVWVLTDKTGIYGYDGSIWKYYGMDLLDNPSAFVVGRNHKLWVGLGSTLLYEHDGKQWNLHRGDFPCPSQLTIAPDQAVWFVGGCAGVYRFDGENWSFFARDKELGGVLPSKIMNAPDGALWFFSSEGWARYKP